MAMLVALATNLHSQADLDTEAAYGLSYLQVGVGNETFLGRQKIAVTYGNGDLMKYLNDENGKKFYFNSFAAIFDYFEKQGWVWFKDMNTRMNGVNVEVMIFRKKS